MLNMILFLIGIVVLIILGIKYKKFYLYFVAALFPIIPTYWAIEITPEFPLITVGRLILIYTFVFTFIKTPKERYKNIFTWLWKSKFIWAIAAIVLCKGISTIAALPSITAVKNYMSFGVEQMLFVFCLCLSVDSRECIEKILKILLGISMILVVFAVIESFLGCNVFLIFSPKFERNYVAHISYERLGIIRASGPFEHPIALALYTLLMYCIAMYKFLTSEKYIQYGIVSVALILMELLTISRFAIMCMGLVTLLFVVFGNKLQKIRMGKLIGLVVLFLILAFPVRNLPFFATLYRIIASVLDCSVGVVTGIDFTQMLDKILVPIQETVVQNNIGMAGNVGEKVVTEFGTNANPYPYRMFLFEVTYDVLKDNFWFGLGGAFFQNNFYDVSHMANATFRELRVVDNAYLYLIMTEGVMGFVGTVYYYLSVLWINIKNWRKTKGITLNKVFAIMLVGYYVALLASGMLGSIRLFCVMSALVISNRFIQSDEKTLN